VSGDDGIPLMRGSVRSDLLGDHSFRRGKNIDSNVRPPADPRSASRISRGLWVMERRAPGRRSVF